MKDLLARGSSNILEMDARDAVAGSSSFSESFPESLCPVSCALLLLLDDEDQ